MQRIGKRILEEVADGQVQIRAVRHELPTDQHPVRRISDHLLGMQVGVIAWRERRALEACPDVVLHCEQQPYVVRRPMCGLRSTGWRCGPFGRTYPKTQVVVNADLERFHQFHTREFAKLIAEVAEYHHTDVCLTGMSDNITMNFGAHEYNVTKYVPYGPVESVIPYLIRRAQENSGIAGQMSRELKMILHEQTRRNQLKLSGNA